MCKCDLFFISCFKKNKVENDTVALKKRNGQDVMEQKTALKQVFTPPIKNNSKST